LLPEQFSQRFVADFRRRSLDWFAQEGRHDLPWQQPASPYRVWVSEVMLQQTQVATVIPYFARFVDQFPDVPALAAASLDSVMALWSGLGYYSRARNLHKAARSLVENSDSRLPEDLRLLQKLPGVGRSTAGAILSFGFGQPAPILDGNIKRVLARCFAIEGDAGQSSVQSLLWRYAEALTPEQQAGPYNQSMMDIGAMICTRGTPACGICPLQEICMAFQQSRQHELPTPRARKAKPLKKIFVLLLQSKAGILLERRPERGVWGGLWSLPEMSSSNDWPTWLPSKEATSETLAPLTHEFTHFKLQLTPVKIVLKSSPSLVSEASRSWYRPGDTRGLPAPIRKLLDRLQ